MVVEVGLTDNVPPVSFIVRLLPLVPVIAIAVALLAATVKVEELPLGIDVGLALIVTVGAGELAAVPTAGLLTLAPANAGTAHGMSMESMQQTSFIAVHRRFSLPREYTQKWDGFKINFRIWELRGGEGKRL